MERETRDDVMKKTPLSDGMARLETVHEDAEGNVLSYDCTETKGLLRQPGVGRRVADLPMMPFLGPLGGILITIPTAGHNAFAADIAALTGWEIAIGIGTAPEVSGDTTLSSEIATYGGARASVTPTVLTNVVTWTHQWTFITGADFVVSEVGIFRSSTIRLRHLYSATKHCVVSDKLTATLTDTM